MADVIKGTIYLMRHGRTALDVDHRSDGWLDMPLSTDGQLSLMPAQQHLKTKPIRAIYAPDLKRTQETAHIVASGTLSKPTIHTVHAIKTWNLGVLAGTRKRYGRPEVTRLMHNPTEAPMGGESYSQFCGRFLPWCKKIAKQVRESGRPILVVCSGSNLRCLGDALFGDPDCMDLDEGGLAALHHSKSRWHKEVLMGGKGNPPSLSGGVGGKEADLRTGALSAMNEALEDRKVMS